MDEQRAGRLQALKQHPSWPELEAEVEEQYQKYRDAVSRLVMSGHGVPDNFEYKRGFLAGMKAIVKTPGDAAKQLEKAIAKSKLEEGDA